MIFGRCWLACTKTSGASQTQDWLGKLYKELQAAEAASLPVMRYKKDRRSKFLVFW